MRMKEGEGEEEEEEKRRGKTEVRGRQEKAGVSVEGRILQHCNCETVNYTSYTSYTL
jgi:hypothetical protein